METEIKNQTITGEPIISPFYPTPNGKPINAESISQSLLSKNPPIDISSVINKLSTSLASKSPISLESISQKLAANYGLENPEKKTVSEVSPEKEPIYSIFNLNDPRYKNIKTLAQIPSALLGSFPIQPTWDFLSSGAELITGKPLPKLKISALTEDMPPFVDASSYQQKYQEQIDAGVPEKEAYKNIFREGIIDAILLAGPIKGGLRAGIKTFAPEKLIKPEISALSGQTLFDYLSGKKTAEQLGLSQEVRNLISDKMKAMTTAEKTTFLQGFDLLKAKPSVIGKVFGVSEAEANQILADVFNGPIRESARGALPGYRMSFEAGGANIKGEPVGKEVISTEKGISDVDKLIAEGKIRVMREGNRDIYQYKNLKGEWARATGEDDAVMKATKEPVPKYKPKDQQKIDFNKAQIESVRERLIEHPARPLLKYLSEGDFQDFKNPNLANSVKEAEKIKAKNKEIMDTAQKAFQDNPELQDNFDNPDTIRQVIEDYRGQREVEKSLVASKKFLEENLKPLSQIIRERFRLKSPLLDTEAGWGRSVEIQANQALSILNGEEYPMYVSFPEIISGTITPVKQKVNTIDTYLRTPRFVMEKIGFGKEAQMLRDGMEKNLEELPKQIKQITSWLERLGTKEAQLNVYRWLDGEAITLPFYEKEVAKDIRKWLQDWAKRLKLPEDNRISRYITHIFSREIIEKEFDEELAKIITDKIPKETYDPFLLKRLGRKGYIQDLGLSLDAYAKRAVRKVHMDPALEAIREKAGVQLEFSNIEKSQFKYIQRYIENIQMRPTDLEEGIDNLVKSVIGYRFGQRPAIALLRTFRQATFRGMLGLNPTSALRNLSQGINTYAVLGEKYTARGYLNLFLKGAMQELAERGILKSTFIQDRLQTSRQKFMEKSDKVLFSLFDTVEKINRGAAYFGAKAKYLDEHAGDKLVPYKTYEDEAIKYAKKVVAQTQFLYDTVDTPVGMSSGLAKTLFQFQTYTTKQLEFLFTINKGKGYKGAQKLKYAVPYIRYILAGLTFVYTVGRAFGMEPKELLPWFRFDTPPSLKFPSEVVKAVVGAPDEYGNKRTLKEKGEDVLKAGLGLIPAGSQLKKTYQGIMAIKEGGSFSPSGKLQFIQGMSTAQKAQAIIFGKYAGQNAKEYFKKDKTDYSSVIPVYNKAQEMLKNGDEAGAKTYVNSVLDDAGKDLYKKYKTQQKSFQTLQGKKDILPFYLKMQELKKTDIEEARRQVNELSPEQKKYYQLIKNQVEKDTNAAGGEKPAFQDGEVQTARGIIGTVVTYAEALGTDPITAFNRIFTGQKIRYVASGAIVVERMSLAESQSVKEKLGGKTNDFKLDHLIPLELGGSNSEDNLVLVPTDKWASFTPVENYLGKKLRNGTIGRKEAQDLIVKLKTGELTAKEIIK